MAWDITADPERFVEAVESFQERVPVTVDDLEDLTRAERARAFHIASVNELSVVRTVYDELDRAIANNLPIQDFRKAVREKVGKHQIGGAHLDTVFRNAVQTAYNTGRWTQITSADVTQTKPYWMYDAVLDTRTTEVCRALDTTVKAHDDPFWLTRWPPNHHRCRSSVRAVRRREAERRGITVGDPPGGEPQGGFGLAPPLRGAEPLPDPARVKPELLGIFDRRRNNDPDLFRTDEDED